MRILVAHNYYQQAGGEAQVFAAECRLLEEAGHNVFRYTKDNRDIPTIARYKLLGMTFWNNSSYRELRELMRNSRIDLIHIHNMLPLISPSAYYAARHERVPVVQTLHNFRLMCPNALLYRDHHLCNDCVGKLLAWPAIVHRCYRDSASASASVAFALAAHKVAGTYRRLVDLFIVLSEFSRAKYVEAGFDESQLFVKPNFVVDDPGIGTREGQFCLFVGRLSEEKGIRALLDEWEQRVPHRLVMVGDGPLRSLVEQTAARSEKIDWLGRVPNEQVIALMKEATIMVFPSACYENFPVTIAEALAVGLPVVAANIGSIPTIISDGSTGALYDAEAPGDLASKVDSLWLNPESASRISLNARREFEEKYSRSANYERLMEAYDKAKARSQARS